MKYLIIILVLMNTNLVSQIEEYDIYSKYYNISNNILYSLVITNDEYIFYGDNGGVLKTYDAGKTWKQEFIGTHNFIFDLKFIDNNLYGVTSGGEFIYSSDKGKNWNIYKVNNEVLNKITKLNDDLYIISKSRELFVSTNFGKDWNKIYSFDKDITDLEFFEDNLIAKTQNGYYGTVFISENNGLDWNELNLPNNEMKNSLKLKKIKDNIIIHNESSFAELNSDLSWDYYSTEERVIFDLVKIKDKYHCLNYHGDSLEIYDKIYSTANNKFVDSVTYSRIGVSPGDYRILSTSSDDKNILLTSYNKTIIKINDLGKKIEVLNTIPKEFNGYLTILDSLNWLYSSDINGNSIGGNLLKSTNGGITFNFTPKHFIDSTLHHLKGDVFYGIPVPYPISKDTFLLRIDNTFAGIPSFNPNHFYIYTSKDSNFIPLDNFKNKISSNSPKYIINKFGDIVYLFHGHGTLKKFIFYKFNTKTFELDSLSYIDSLKESESSNIYIENNNIWLYGYTGLREKRFYIYLSKDTCKSWELKYEYQIEQIGNLNGFYKSKETNNYYLFHKLYSQELLIFEFDDFDDFNNNNIVYDGREFGDKKLYRYFEDKLYIPENNKYFEDIDFIHGYLNESVSPPKGIYFNVKLSIVDNKIKVDTINQINDRFKVLNAYFDDSYAYIFNYSLYNIYKPITKNIPNNVNANTLKASSFWTYPPYPNPVKDILKMKFYSAMMNQIANLKVELIEIGSGRIYRVENYEISKTSDYWGEIIIDIGNYQTGAYLINFKLGDSNKSEAIIIE